MRRGRRRRPARRVRATPFRGLFAALVAAQVGYSYLPERRRPPATRAIVLLLLATSSAETVSARGRGRGTALLGSAAALGFGSELVGVATGRPFGHYSYGPGLGPQVRGVPLLAAAAWTMMSRPAWVVAGLVDRRPLLRVPLAAGALAAWDVFLDPRMVREGYWTWPGGGRYEDVPAQNFLGWVAIGLLVFSVWAALDRDDGPGGDGALALYIWTWLGESYASAAIWRRPRVAAAGGLAMGVFAVPALRQRLGAGGSRA